MSLSLRKIIIAEEFIIERENITEVTSEDGTGQEQGGTQHGGTTFC
jgi:hypothetical protein